MVTVAEAIKAQRLIPDGAPVTVSPNLCDRIPDRNKPRIWDWLDDHPLLMVATWTGDPSDRRSLYSSAGADLFGAEPYWSVTELARRIYVAACPEREESVKPTSPGLLGQNFWSYRGQTLTEIAGASGSGAVDPAGRTITINGNTYRMTGEQVRQKAAGCTPDAPYDTYGVVVGSVLWPPRELMRCVTGEHLDSSVNSQTLMAFFDELGLLTWTRTVYMGGKPEVHQARRRGPNKQSR
ncbi:hypothetical protein ABZW03_09185 [Kitasatospora sp. NPDC004799]|uniref:hypothetical protein n=1 Tax=Kitasatospora sp. NPDC004799 TaxID=3154460 RepID=UPI0033A7A679